jgi:hypothetical protein
MDAVLASMRRLEGFTEVVNRLRAIMKVHEESVSEAKKSYRREVDSIFEEAPPGGSTEKVPPGPLKPPPDGGGTPVEKPPAGGPQPNGGERR